MMAMENILSEKIIATFMPSHYEVHNESGQHAGPASESHFKIIIVSNTFDNMSLITRHRAVNTLFADELKKIHALAMHTYTQDEWQQKHHGAPTSPQCAH